MLLTSNHPARIYATAKTCKVSSVGRININDLKFKPKTDKTGTMILNSGKFISNYLKSFCKNNYNIQDTLSFGDILQLYHPLQWLKPLFLCHLVIINFHTTK